MKTYSLSNEELEFFKKYLSRSFFTILITKHCEKDKPCTIQLSKEQANQLVGEFADLFCEIGLKKDDEPNEMGLYIEEYIDKFNPLYHETSNAE